MREDRSVLDLLESDHTFLNERLAKHYGIPHVYGSRFRRVTLGDDSQPRRPAPPGEHPDRDLLRDPHVARDPRQVGLREHPRHAPPPPPPANVPALKDNTVSATLSVRERLAEHRANAACAGCHKLMDPVGFALENFDAVGRWRAVEGGPARRRHRRLARRQQFDGVDGLEQALLAAPGVCSSRR